MHWIFWILAAAVLLSVLYLFLTAGASCSEAERKPYISHYFAHRGYFDRAAGIPENSIPAFRRAVENGFGMELDVQLSSDGVPVVFHDESLKRVAHLDRNLQDCTYQELMELHLDDTDCRIPTFEQVLETVDGRTPLIVEIKPEGNWKGACEKAAALLDAYGGTFCVESFSPLVVRWFKKNRPDWIRGQLSESYDEAKKWKWAAKIFLSTLMCNILSRPDFIAYEYAPVCPVPVRLFQIFSKRSFRVVWTVKSREQLENARKNYQVFIFEGFDPDAA